MTFQRRLLLRQFSEPHTAVRRGPSARGSSEARFDAATEPPDHRLRPPARSLGLPKLPPGADTAPGKPDQSP